MEKPTAYIETMGCQMNKLDSELIAAQLAQAGYLPVDSPECASVVVYNTCSVRQHAEDKVISKVAQLHHRRQDEPFVLAIVGCMAQRLGQELLDSHPRVDIVCGPNQIHQLARLVQEAQSQRRRSILLNDPAVNGQLEQLDASRSADHTVSPFAAYIRVMRGCNNFCTYCIVPYVRGRETSRPISHIVDEARRLVDKGIREITLLGQTVNAYDYAEAGTSYTLADVLEALHDLPGLDRLRFVTSFPRDFHSSILHAMADLPNVCPYLHLPAQSGSDRVLKLMKRRYTASEYLDLLQEARDIVGDLTVAGDFIVGFPTETDHDFELTCELLRAARYKNAFIFKYSPRPNTFAEKNLPDDVPEPVKRKRNTTLLDLQNAISLEDNQRFVGQTVSVLVENLSPKPHLNTQAPASEDSGHSDAASQPTQHPQLIGRTPGDHIVVFNGPTSLIGQITPVTVTKASALTLFAQL